MGLFPKPKTQTLTPIKKAAPPVTAEDPTVKQAGDAERRRLAQMWGRKDTVQGARSPMGYKTVLGV